MRWVGLLLVMACSSIPPGPPGYPRQLTAELAALSPFAYGLAHGCGQEGPVTLDRAPEGAMRAMIATDPPIMHASWGVEACGAVVPFILDCSRRPGRGWHCRPHGWLPFAGNADVGGARLAQVAEAAPECFELCKGCGPDLHITIHPDGHYTVVRCGQRKEVRLVCDGLGPCRVTSAAP